MTGLLGRLLPLFTGQRRVEDLFTEALARLFERRPDLCLGWLEEAGLLPPGRPSAPEGVRMLVTTQKRLVSLEPQDAGSRPDLLVEVHRSASEGPPDNGETAVDAVMIESKIGSTEGRDQLRRYAEHLGAMGSFGGKTLAYVTRAYDPKDADEILEGVDRSVRFAQLRWHDFYRFLERAGEKDALAEEVMLFMEEQGMARDYRFSATDLVALSGMPRAVEIMDETIGEEVRAELEAFAGGKSRMESISNFRRLWRYGALAQLHGFDLLCLVSYHLGDPDEYPWLAVGLQAQPRALERGFRRRHEEDRAARRLGGLQPGRPRVLGRGLPRTIPGGLPLPGGPRRGSAALLRRIDPPASGGAWRVQRRAPRPSVERLTRLTEGD